MDGLKLAPRGGAGSLAADRDRRDLRSCRSAGRRVSAETYTPHQIAGVLRELMGA
jgi:hypothetical protein